MIKSNKAFDFKGIYFYYFNYDVLLQVRMILEVISVLSTLSRKEKKKKEL